MDTQKNLMMFTVVVAIIFGAWFLFAPNTYNSVMGVKNPIGALQSQFSRLAVESRQRKVRTRRPRYCMPGSALVPFDEKLSACFTILVELEEGRFLSDVPLLLVNVDTDRWVLLTRIRIILTRRKKMKIKWQLPFKDVVGISLKDLDPRTKASDKRMADYACAMLIKINALSRESRRIFGKNITTRWLFFKSRADGEAVRTIIQEHLKSNTAGLSLLDRTDSNTITSSVDHTAELLGSVGSSSNMPHASLVSSEHAGSDSEYEDFGSDDDDMDDMGMNVAGDDDVILEESALEYRKL